MPSSMESSNSFLVPIAAGELLDKITILRLKAKRLQRPEALANVGRELEALQAIVNDAGTSLSIDAVLTLTGNLQAINTQLWDVEDKLRLLEADQSFDAEFIALARSVYQLNDERAALKRQINEASGSSLMEEKSYGEQLNRQPQGQGDELQS